MKYAACLFAAVLAMSSLGCHSLSHGLYGECLDCGGGVGCSDCASCAVDQPCSDCLAADAHGASHPHGQGGGLLGHGILGGGQAGYAEYAQPGPPVGTVTYPYYTFHGPRDFLQGNPPSLGR